MTFQELEWDLEAQHLSKDWDMETKRGRLLPQTAFILDKLNLYIYTHIKKYILYITHIVF